ncbi:MULTISPECIES: dephospho-CoA kinase [unclassified Halomonas]|uniref:dephospho-CoA kinase n=1 Tax=unclassified Halomonas TaxID=2609666 RepID=UPI0006D973B9|nr:MULTISPECIES: dephospho-CoA kinase [unclassified Halomonas]KPQ18956.1 MAG: dephospho-CoA kinase CoaE [Halomonas sp. HL-93]SBR48977.1 dephospho-CoA kinase [Halomonas sp. HL-93]SNY96013.1 dephospho-CoA kinase [Halomonas sp. hl-4]
MIIGLTGGIGSGKSTVARAFGERGIGWVDADDVAREVVAPGEPALTDILNRFGPEVIAEDGSLNRATLREIVFEEPEQRQWLEQLTHPLIRERLIAALRHIEAGPSPYALLVSPLLFESGQAALVDRTLVIDIPTDMQLSRTLKRDGVSEANVRAILKAQMSREERCARADDIIDNSRDIAHMKQQVASLDQAYRAYLSS